MNHEIHDIWYAANNNTTPVVVLQGVQYVLTGAGAFCENLTYSFTEQIENECVPGEYLMLFITQLRRRVHEGFLE